MESHRAAGWPQTRGGLTTALRALGQGRVAPYAWGRAGCLHVPTGPGPSSYTLQELLACSLHCAQVLMPSL